MQRNTTGLYAALFPWVSRRMHEHYFTRCTDAPIVFNDLRDGELRHLCPGGVPGFISAPSACTTWPAQASTGQMTGYMDMHMDMHMHM